MPAAMVVLVAQVSAPPKARLESSTASSAPMAMHSFSMTSAWPGPMETTVTVLPGY